MVHSVQRALRISALKVPSGHGVGELLPSVQYVPDGQSMHWSRLVMMLISGCLCVPPGHGMAAEAPSLHTEPAGQSMHAVVPSAPWNLPPRHLLHLDIPSSPANVPTLQLAGCAAPPKQKVPIGHLSQEDEDASM